MAGCRPQGEERSYYEGTDSRRMKSRDQYYEKKLENGTIVRVAHGLSQTWYPDGTPSSEMNLKHDKPYGEAKIWYSNGQLRVVNNFNENGLLHGRQIWYKKDGQILKEHFMDNGTGIDYMFNENGQIKAEIMWKEGVRDGAAKFYDENGELLRTEIYIKGIRQLNFVAPQ